MTLSLLFAASASISANAQIAGAASLPQIETVGTGERRVAPDRATVHLIVSTKASAAADAATSNARAIQAVRDTLRRLGFDSAVTTASYNVGPDYESIVNRDDPRPRGYAARTVVRVRVVKLDQVGRIIDAALAKGATGVETVQFESSVADDARRTALAEASIAARRDAEALATALGGSIGSLISASTAGNSDPRRMNVMMEVAGGRAVGGTQIRPDEIVIVAGVVTRWEFIARPAR
ncbi:MAG: SIMPL domain-containing protein [Gemmatimonadaceae bacterium]|nr:SIMPL domain-containing protein [Gemmatimonadaceae bacterium]